MEQGQVQTWVRVTSVGQTWVRVTSFTGQGNIGQVRLTFRSKVG